MKTITVAPEDDLRAILQSLSEKTAVMLKKGVYRQKIVVPPLCVELCGEDAADTIITNADYAKKIHADGLEYNTFRTFTVCVTGERCTLRNLTVENTAKSPETKGQSVALSVNCKSFLGENLILKSTQDTLFCAPFPDDLVARYSGVIPEPVSGDFYYDGFIPRDQLYIEGGTVQVYKNCRIYGNVDFIFGGGEAWFDNCEIVSVSDKRGTGFVAAPCHNLASKRGFTFVSCSFTAEGAEKNSVYLARPWRDFGKCDFINCTLGAHIKPQLFDKWNDTYRDRTARFAYLGFGGKGAVSWAKRLTEKQAEEILGELENLVISD